MKKQFKLSKLAKLQLKFDLKMKLTTFFLIVSLFQIQANESHAQKTKITLNLKNVSLEKVINEIESLTDFKFLYNYKDADYKKVISINAKKEKVSSVLERLFKDLNLSFQVLDKQIIIKKNDIRKTTNNKKAVLENLDDKSIVTQNTISGFVKDNSGVPIPGVNILIQGTTTGTQTDFDGKYSLNANKGDVLVFSYIGYKTQNIKVGDTYTIDLVLEEDTAELEEVVVVGYGTQKKITVTGAVASINSKDVTVVPTPNLLQNIQGRLPGLNINLNSGRPGVENVDISIRGFGANNGVGNANQDESPLIIVDGFQRDFSQLDPNEIESISILKDAAAAVYGVRAGAGVILVTTKRGKTGKPVITFNSTYSLTDFTTFPELANYQGYLKAVSQHRDGANDQVVDNITSERLALLEAGDPGTDWFDVITNNLATLNQHNFNIRGGSEKIKYFTSLGYLDEGTIWASGDFGYKRYNSSFNLDFEASDNLKVGVQFGWRREERSDDRAVQGVDLFTIAFSNPGFPSSLPDPDRVVGANIDNAFSPLASTQRDLAGYIDTRTDNINVAMETTYKVPSIRGLSLTGRVGYLQTYRFRSTLSKPYQLWYLTDAGYLPQNGREQTTLSEQAYRFERLTTNISANYSKSFNKHNISALLLYEKLSEQSRIFAANGNDLLSSSVPFLNTNNPDFATISGSGTEFGRTGLVGRLNYDYDEKYLLELSFRQDKSSYFPESSRTGFFPGISAGWVVSKEEFMKDAKAINFLKLRGSYSRLGNDGTNTYDYLDGFQQLRGENGYVFDGDYQSIIRTLGIPNPQITWQESDLYNIGLEMGFINNRLNLEMDAFYRKRSRLLAVDPGTVIVETSGAQLPFENIETRDNRGVEAILSFRGTKGDFSYSLTANGSWSREKWIKNFSDPEAFLTPDRERIQKISGNWVNRTFGHVFDGFFTQEEIDDIDNLGLDYFNGQNGNLRAGDIKLKDINGDGIINFDDQVVIGRSTVPEIMYGFNAELKYKNWDFTMFWQGAANFNQNFSGRQIGISVGNIGTSTPYQYVVDNLWTDENQGVGAEFPRDTQGVTLTNGDVTNIDKYFKNSSYIRLKNLAIGYSLPKDILKKSRIQNIRLSLSGTNLLTLDNLGVLPWDPETGGAATYPAMRVYTLGLNISL